MKVLLVSDYATPTGGIEHMTLALRAGLRERGHDARFFSSTARPLGAALRCDYACHGTVSPFRTLLQTANPWAARRLRAVLAAFRPDIVHVRLFLTQLSPLILPVLRSVPALLHVETYRPVCPTGTKLLRGGRHCDMRAGAVCRHNGCLALHDWVPLSLQMRLWKRWRDVFDRVITCSRWMQTRLRAEGLHADEVLPNGVPLRPARGALAGPPTIGFAGRLVTEKGADVLLRAIACIARDVPGLRLILAGDGPQRAALARLCTALGVEAHVSFLGHVDRTVLEQRFRSAWVQVVPSRWMEPLGNVALEAMMRGTALVASDAGGLNEIVHHDHNGILVTPGDAQALANALRMLLSDRKRAERLGKRGRELALAEFTQDIHVERCIRVYRRTRAIEHQ